jgi:hypothetical protein
MIASQFRSLFVTLLLFVAAGIVLVSAAWVV